MERCVPCDSHWNALQHTVMHCKTLRRTATHFNTLQHITTPHDSRNREWRDACSVIRDTATHCNTLYHTWTHCNTIYREWSDACRVIRDSVSHNFEMAFLWCCGFAVSITQNKSTTCLLCIIPHQHLKRLCHFVRTLLGILWTWNSNANQSPFQISTIVTVTLNPNT